MSFPKTLAATHTLSATNVVLAGMSSDADNGRRFLPISPMNDLKGVLSAGLSALSAKIGVSLHSRLSPVVAREVAA